MDQSIQSLQQIDKIKINTFRKKKIKEKKCEKNLGWAIKNSLKGIFYLFFVNNCTKSPETKKMRKW